MIVSDSKRFLFIHIPKCAGNTVRNWLQQYDTRSNFFWGIYAPFSNPQCTVDLSHITLPMLRRILGAETFDGYFKFAVIRDPYDRAYSSFLEALKFFPGYRRDDGFKRFLTERVAQADFEQLRPGGRKLVHFTPQNRYILDEDGRTVVGTLCRHDHLEEDLRGVAKKLGLIFPDQLESHAVKIAPVVGQYKYMNHYDEDCIRIINQVYRRDFELFGFKILKEPWCGQA